MANEYCATHDKVFPLGGYCEGCGIESKKEIPVSNGTVEYCGTHDKTFSKGATCPGCDPSLIEAQAYEALHPAQAKPRYNHCGEHDQIFEGNTCPAGHDIVSGAPVTVTEQPPVTASDNAPQGESGMGQSAGANLELTENQE